MPVLLGGSQWEGAFGRAPLRTAPSTLRRGSRGLRLRESPASCRRRGRKRPALLGCVCQSLRLHRRCPASGRKLLPERRRVEVGNDDDGASVAGAEGCDSTARLNAAAKAVSNLPGKGLCGSIMRLGRMARSDQNDPTDQQQYIGMDGGSRFMSDTSRARLHIRLLMFPKSFRA